MRNRIIGLAAVLGVLGAACGAAASQPQQALSTGGIVAAAQGESPSVMAPGISVQGTGIVSGIPDVLSITVGIQVTKATVQESLDAAGTDSQALLAVFDSYGIPKDKVQSGQLSVYPRYDYSGEQERIVGYQVSTTYTVQMAKIDRVGEMLDEAGTAVGDDLIVQSIGFSLEDDADLLVSARDAAYADAASKAEQLAALAGVTLGAPIWISEGTTFAPPVFFAQRAAASDEAAAIGVEAGSTDVRVTLDVVFSIGN